MTKALLNRLSATAPVVCAMNSGTKRRAPSNSICLTPPSSLRHAEVSEHSFTNYTVHDHPSRGPRGSGSAGSPNHIGFLAGAAYRAPRFFWLAVGLVDQRDDMRA